MSSGVVFFLIAFGIYILFCVRPPRLDAPWLEVPFGLLVGVLGRAYNANGPPVMICGVFQRWNKDHFRALL